jgi:uncharacterized protein YbjT (DUF2867 family)
METQMAEKILVIGATGRIGTELIQLLLDQGISVRAATRRAEDITRRWGHRVESVHFDYDRPETLAPAVRHVEQIFLMARPTDNHSDKAAMPLVNSARQEGVRHIVNLTAMGVEKERTFALRQLELYIEESGLPFTHLRPNWFMQNFDSGPFLADIRDTGALHLPAADAKVSFIDVRDIAAVGLASLTDSRHLCKAYTLTGGEALDHATVMDIISKAAGRVVPYVPLSEEAACSALARAGVPTEVIERWRMFFRKMRAGDCAPVSADVETILGRKPITFVRYAADVASVWK